MTKNIKNKAELADYLQTVAGTLRENKTMLGNEPYVIGLIEGLAQGLRY